MLKLIIAAIVTTLMLIPYVSEANELWLQVGSVSTHFGKSQYENKHAGIGVEYVTDDRYYSGGKSKNSYGEDLSYAIYARKYTKILSRDSQISLNLGLGAYTYSRPEGEDSKGAYPWLSLSFSYVDVGVNVSYIPENAIRESSDDALVIQFKVKLT